MGSRGKIKPWGLVLIAATMAAAPPLAADCNESFDGTFEMIEKVIFERRGCTSVTCHSGPSPAGDLDLTPGVAYDELIDVAPTSVSNETHVGLKRVVPGSKAGSLLWLNLAAATLPEMWNAPLRPMPQGLPPLTYDELELIRLWIENGAVREGVVPGTGELVDACLPPPRPLETAPLPPPPPGLGVQLRAPRQILAPRTEREVCFVSYYDLTGQVPAEFLGENGTTFRYKRTEARQDPLSHHGVVVVYGGNHSIDDSVWGPFRCAGGEHDGEPCEPTGTDVCGPEAQCGSVPVPSVACIGFGPGNAAILNSRTLFSSMGGPASGNEGIYLEAPLKGILVWNSHAFNVTDEPAKLDFWLNFIFAAPEEQRRPLLGFIDISAINVMHVPAFKTEEVCHHNELRAGIELLNLTSHVHRRGKRFRIFDGRFTCQGGPRNGEACSPFGPEPGLALGDPCFGAPCQTEGQGSATGDCDLDSQVTIDEILHGIRIALGEANVLSCLALDKNGNGKIAVNELVAAVDSLLDPDTSRPEDHLLYTSLTYADPFVLSFDPPRHYPRNAPAADRTLTYCALYDNGFTDPDDVKRNSRVPTNASHCRPTHCAEGQVGRTCTRDADCDTGPGIYDGMCDACTLTFGMTTDDEMFVLIGGYLAE